MTKKKPATRSTRRSTKSDDDAAEMERDENLHAQVRFERMVDTVVSQRRELNKAAHVASSERAQRGLALRLWSRGWPYPDDATTDAMADRSMADADRMLQVCYGSDYLSALERSRDRETSFFGGATDADDLPAMPPEPPPRS